MQIKRLSMFFAFILVLPVAYSLTAAIGNARAILNINASPEEPAVLHRTILVQNRNEIPVKVTLGVDKKFEKFVDIIDKELILEPDESKKARYTLTMDRGGNFEIRINVGFEAADPEIKENKPGMSALLIVNSRGPTIEDEDEGEGQEEEDEDEGEEEEEEEQEEERANPYSRVEDPDFDEEESEGVVRNREKVETDMPSPLIGILIIVIVLAIGMGVFFAIQKLR